MNIGILKHNKTGWYIQTSDKDYKLHPEEEKICNMYGDYSIDWIGKKVEFSIKREKKISYAITEKFVK